MNKETKPFYPPQPDAIDEAAVKALTDIDADATEQVNREYGDSKPQDFKDRESGKQVLDTLSNN